MDIAMTYFEIIFGWSPPWPRLFWSNSSSTRRPRVATSARLAPGFARQTEANNCPSGKTTRRRWRGSFNSRAMRLWMPQASSRGAVLKQTTASPVKSEQVSSMASSWQAKSSCTTMSPQSSASATYQVPGSGVTILHCPWLFIPQATAPPSLLRSTEWKRPVKTWVYVIPSSKRGMLHCPWTFSPRATAMPSLLRSTVKFAPAETWVYLIPSSKRGKWQAPWVLSPQATATPSLLRSTVWKSPADTWV